MTTLRQKEGLSCQGNHAQYDMRFIYHFYLEVIGTDATVKNFRK